nr:MAG TPA: hypothetical protein [Caudoviricetes sp.]
MICWRCTSFLSRHNATSFYFYYNHFQVWKCFIVLYRMTI